MALCPTAIAPDGGPAFGPLGKESPVQELIRYLIDNLYLDFQGEISLDTVKGFLREDESREGRQLLKKLVAERGVDDLLITLADCLKEHIRTGVTDDVVQEQLSTYSQS
jgi:hypothetical protein